MIKSHSGWDRIMPYPRSENKHAEELGTLWRAYANCKRIYKDKCDNCENFPHPPTWWKYIPILAPIFIIVGG